MHTSCGGCARYDHAPDACIQGSMDDCIPVVVETVMRQVGTYIYKLMNVLWHAQDSAKYGQETGLMAKQVARMR